MFRTPAVLKSSLESGVADRRLCVLPFQTAEGAGSRREKTATSSGAERLVFRVFWHKWDRKKLFFEKQSGEVAEKKGKGYIDSQKQIEKQSGEVFENTCLWKKRTENELETKRAMLLKIQEAKNLVENKPQQGSTSAWTPAPVSDCSVGEKLGKLVLMCSTDGRQR